MGKTVLISESESLIGKQLIDIYAANNYKVIAPVEENENQEDTEQESNQITSIPWNKSSVFSTKTLMRETIRQLKTLDEAVIVFSSPSLTSHFDELTIAEIEDILENYINGTVYLSKELIDYFEKRETGLLSFVLFGDINQAPSALASGTMGFFRYFVKGILENTGKGLFKSAYYSQDQSDYKGFADFILKYNQSRLEKADGEWLKYTEKKSIFSSLPIIKKDF